MSVIRNHLHIYFVLLIFLYCCDHSETIQLLPINVIDGIRRLENFLGISNEIPILANEISNIVANGGLKKYHSGNDNEDKDLNITQLIQKYCRPAEEHHVQTTDGFIITLFRIPSNGSAVLLMHGLLSSSDDWVTAGPGRALPYLLAEKGYDVWLGNARGNKHSRRHVHLSPASAEFWNFSWDEIGRYDLPAMIDHMLHVTGQLQIKYVGHSQGTTSFFVMCSERPEYNKKVSLMVALAAVAWMSHLISPVIRIIVPFRKPLSFLVGAAGLYEFLPSDILVRTLSRAFCGNTEFAKLICNNIAFLFGGFNYDQTNVDNLPVITSHTPGGCSFKQLLHYAQEIQSGKFRRYDYGSWKNLKVYGSVDPPDYPVEKITAPVAIFYSHTDWLSNVTDVEILVGKLKRLVDYYEVPIEKFSHTDYLWAKDVRELVYLRILQLFENF